MKMKSHPHTPSHRHHFQIPVQHLVALLIILLALAHGHRASAADAIPNAEASAMLDKLLAEDWKARGLQGNPRANDGTIVRRLYLDIAGRIPTLAETRGFLEDRAPDKRAR